MATVTFLWHLHQPCYRTLDSVVHAPWALLHAGGSYTTLARSIIEAGAEGQVLNIVPTLLEQLEAYRDGIARDPVREALLRPADELSEAESVTLLEWAFHVPNRQLDRYPRLRELGSRRSVMRRPERLAASFGRGDLRDLQVLLILAKAGDQAWRDPVLGTISPKGRHFSAEDHRVASQWLAAQPGELIALWETLRSLPGIEIATSPFAHPIMPLLVDTGVVRDSWVPYEPPQVPLFRHPEDARLQLRTGLRFMRDRGYEPQGCWPPEGSVSAAALEVYAEESVRWLVTDEGILERSLGRAIRSKDATAPQLYRSWRLETPSPMIFFRDRWLSDRIGFTYGNWHDEGRAARDMIGHLRSLAQDLPADAAIVIALDGENAWLHYPDAGGVFLAELFTQLRNCRPELEPATLTQLEEKLQPQALPRIHPGSWINSIFATWIGHPEKTNAWRVLTTVRDALAQSSEPQPSSLLLAEGSDWFWWLGDDNPTPLAPLYDRIFRQHLADACSQAGVEPPVDLNKPLKTLTLPLRVPLASTWRPPTLDGRVTSYFEWSLAVWVEAERAQPLRRMALWAGPGKLHLLIEGALALSELIRDNPLVIHLQSAGGETTDLIIDESNEDDPEGGWAVGRIAEASLPWDGSAGSRLEVRLGPLSLPTGAVLVLEPFSVDEESNGGACR